MLKKNICHGKFTLHVSCLEFLLGQEFFRFFAAELLFKNVSIVSIYVYIYLSFVLYLICKGS